MPHREPRNKGTNLCNPNRQSKTMDPLNTKPRETIVIDNLNQLKVKHSFDTRYGYKGFNASMAEIGFTRDFIKSPKLRTLAIDITSGYPLAAATTWPHRIVELEGAISMYTIIEHEDPEQFRLVMIGCGERTVYLVIKPKLAYSFVLDAVSLDATEGVLNLYAHQLDKGNGLFTSTIGILDDLFYKLFAAVVDSPTLQTFQIRHIKGDVMKMKLYLFPQQPDKNMLSSNGWVFDVHLSEFPGKQISRGFNLQQKELRKKRDQVESREHWNREAGRPTMNDAERKRMIARMDS